MAYNLITARRDQVFLLPPTLTQWLPSEHLVYQVIPRLPCLRLGRRPDRDAVEALEMEPFLLSGRRRERRYNAEGAGEAAFPCLRLGRDPALMRSLLLYGHYVGERSSRRLERWCYEHVAFRVAAGNQQPHFTTIARFRREHAAALTTVFVQVLERCHRARARRPEPGGARRHPVGSPAESQTR